jgi:osmotically-inducible protein OsmY
LALTGWLLFENSRRTEALLRERVGALLSSYGISTDIASVSGRDVYLRGAIVSELSRNVLVAEIAAIDGVRRVFADTLRIDAPPERAAQLTITLSEISVTASGVMTELNKQAILVALEAIADGRTVLDSLETAERVSETPWLSGVLEFLPKFTAEVRSGSLSATAGAMTLEGLILDEERRAMLTDAATALTDGLVITNNLVIAEPLLPDPDIRITLRDGVITLAGDVPEEFIPLIVAAAADLYGAANVINQLNVALMTSPAWLQELIDALPAIAAEVTAFDIAVSSGVLTVLGEARDAAAHNDFLARLTALLANTFEIRDGVTVLPPASDQLALSVREDDGMIILSGTVSRAVQTNLLNTLARRNVESALELSDNVITPQWLLALIRQLPTYLTTVSDASIEIDTGVRLLGRVSSNAEKAALEANIRSAIGEDVVLENALIVTGVPFRLRWQLVGGDVQLAGNVTEAFAAEVSALSAALARVRSVSSNLSLYEEARAPGWVSDVLGALDTLLADAQELTLDFSSSSLRAEGALLSAAAKARFDEALAALLNDGIVLENAVIALSDDELERAELVTVPEDILTDDAPLETTDSAVDLGATPADTAVITAEVLSGTTELEAADSAAPPLSAPEDALPTAVIEATDAAAAEPPGEEAADAAAPEPSDDTERAAESDLADEATDAMPTAVAPEAEVDGVEQVMEVGVAPAPTPVLQEGETSDVAASTEVVTQPLAPPPVAATPTSPSEPAELDAEPEIIITLPTLDPAAAPTHQLRIDGANGRIVISGVVPNAAALESLRATFAEASVSNVRVHAAAPEMSWLPELLAVASELNAALNRFSLQIDDTALYIGGVVGDALQRDSIAAAVTAALSPPFTVINRLSLQPLAPLPEDGK